MLKPLLFLGCWLAASSSHAVTSQVAERVAMSFLDRLGVGPEVSWTKKHRSSQSPWNGGAHWELRSARYIVNIDDTTGQVVQFQNLAAFRAMCDSTRRERVPSGFSSENHIRLFARTVMRKAGFPVGRVLNVESGRDLREPSHGGTVVVKFRASKGGKPDPVAGYADLAISRNSGDIIELVRQSPKANQRQSVARFDGEGMARLEASRRDTGPNGWIFTVAALGVGYALYRRHLAVMG